MTHKWEYSKRVNDLAARKAEAVRTALRIQSLAAFGSYEALADALDLPRKSVYRYLTERGKDRVMPPLWFVIEAVELLSQYDGVTNFPDFWAKATRGVD